MSLEKFRDPKINYEEYCDLAGDLQGLVEQLSTIDYIDKYCKNTVMKSSRNI